ncbi:uncharacterized protein EI90DRAFT_2529818 [Cantharellus anzutake]|uniref:uncharacterized protein n=1 Tax=Cantharellus anzutake TaxID=1750568 RepID=UPI001903A276|nr:uncharacterized protein EI90DRAFT_2529818 [Cantharellus anzutake]KAF8338007.1 hypothetical protein EI90DRAFT_2529818 [Cantharellus anzutake]
MHMFITPNITNGTCEAYFMNRSECANLSNITGNVPDTSKHPLHDIQDPYPPQHVGFTRPKPIQTAFGIIFLVLVLTAFGYGFYVFWKKILTVNRSQGKDMGAFSVNSKVAPLVSSEDVELSAAKPSARSKHYVRFNLDDSDAHSVSSSTTHSGYGKVSPKVRLDNLVHVAGP